MSPSISLSPDGPVEPFVCLVASMHLKITWSGKGGKVSGKSRASCFSFEHQGVYSSKL